MDSKEKGESAVESIVIVLEKFVDWADIEVVGPLSGCKFL